MSRIKNPVLEETVQVLIVLVILVACANIKPVPLQMVALIGGGIALPFI
jgi:hypothetical protein